MYSFHFLHKNKKVPTITADTFWGNEGVRSSMFFHRFENHAIQHVLPCFKKAVNADFCSHFSFSHHFIFNRFDEDFFMDKSDEADVAVISSLSHDQDDIYNRCIFTNDDFILPTTGLDHYIINNADDD